MARLKQKRLANNIVLNLQEQRWNTLRDLLIASGYATTTALKETKAIIQSQGVQETLVKLGFNENTAKAIIGEILLMGEEGNRIRAAQEVFKVNGTYAPVKQVGFGVTVTGTIADLVEKLNHYEPTQ